MNQPDKKFLFDNRIEGLRIDYKDINISIAENNFNKIKTFCSLEENENVLNPRVILGQNYGVTFDESDYLQLTKNYDGESV